MGLFNFKKESISGSTKEKVVNIENEDTIKGQDQDFGPISQDKILEYKKLLQRLVNVSSDKSKEIRTTKESGEDKEEKIKKIKESMGL